MLWITSRRLVGLPDLTADDMSEAQYATLIYVKQCSVRRVSASVESAELTSRAQFCPSTKSTFQVDFGLHVRSCHKCIRDKCVRYVA